MDSLPKPELSQPVFPFFVGCGRSGTTLIRAIFDSHPDVCIPDEVSFLVRLSAARNRWRYQRGNAFDRDALLDLLRRNSSFRRWEFPESEIGDLKTDPSLRSFSDVMRAVYRSQATRDGKTRYGDKTPMHVLHMPRLLRLFPEAKFVHIVRDGRDVASSYLSIKEWGPSSIEEAALDWKRRLTIGRRDGTAIGPGRYLEIRYEDLVTDTHRIVAKVCGFLGLEFDERMLRYHERAQTVIGDVRFPNRHENLRLPPTRGLRDWRRDMSPEDVVKFELLAGDVLTELGYDRKVSGGWSSSQRFYRAGLRMVSGVSRALWWIRAMTRGVTAAATNSLRLGRTPR